MTRKNVPFNFFVALSEWNQFLNVWWLHHEINCITASALKLNRTWRGIAIEDGPFFSNSRVCLKHVAIQLDKRLLNHGLIFTKPAFYIHHSREGAASCNPISRVAISQILDATHIATEPFRDKHGSVHAQTIAILWIKVWGECTATLISKKVSLWSELAKVFSVVIPLYKLGFKKQNQ